MSNAEQGGEPANCKRTRRNVLAIGGIFAGTAFSRLGNKEAAARLRLGCYLKGTRLRTPDGERRIEELKIGDLVTTRGGDSKPIEWIGRRVYRRAADKGWVESVQPVRIARGALGPNMPHSDLWVSQRHAVLVDGLLIPAIELLNGSSIALDPGPARAEIEYLHIKLASHDVILAEGAPSETLLFQDDGTVELFDNFVEYERLYGSSARIAEEPCAPAVVLAGGRDRLRSRLRSLFSPWIDRRNDFDRARDRLEERA
jgi:hypothetical protein